MRTIGWGARRCWETGALPWHGQIARATRGRDLHLNVPFPRKQPDLLMAESPPTGGLSALNRPIAVNPLAARRLSSAPRRPALFEPCRSTLEVRCATHLWRMACGLCRATVRRARPSRTPRAKGAREGGASGQDVVQRGREPFARLLELTLDVQARRASIGPQVEEVGPARQARIVGLGDRLDPVALARRQHQLLGAVVLD